MSNELEWGMVPETGLGPRRRAAAEAGATTRIRLLDEDEDDAWTGADEEDDDDLDELDDLDDDDDEEDDEDWDDDDEDWEDDLDEDEEEL